MRISGDADAAAAAAGEGSTSAADASHSGGGGPSDAGQDHDAIEVKAGRCLPPTRDDNLGPHPAPDGNLSFGAACAGRVSLAEMLSEAGKAADVQTGCVAARGGSQPTCHLWHEGLDDGWGAQVPATTTTNPHPHHSLFTRTRTRTRTCALARPTTTNPRLRPHPNNKPSPSPEPEPEPEPEP